MEKSQSDNWQRAELGKAQDKAVILGDAAAAAARALDRDDPKTRPVRTALVLALKETGYRDLPSE